MPRGLGVALKEHQKALHLGREGIGKGVKNNLNCLLMEVEVTLVLHVLVWKVDHLGQHDIARVIPKLQRVEFRFEVCIVKRIEDSGRWSLCQCLHDGHEWNPFEPFLHGDVSLNF